MRGKGRRKTTKPRKNRYQLGIRVAVIVLLLFLCVLSFALELLFARG